MLLEAGSDPRCVRPLPSNSIPNLGYQFSFLDSRSDAAQRRRIKDKHNCVAAEYLTNVDAVNGVDRSIQRMIAIATAEFNIGANAGDIASDDDDDAPMGSGSGSD